ncbi:hypothetical protein BLOT_012350 [Blomia tropicalis]|nr:hypothetical protein BLOT_012350 [Blomia tropicalis]
MVRVFVAFGNCKKKLEVNLLERIGIDRSIRKNVRSNNEIVWNIALLFFGQLDTIKNEPKERKSEMRIVINDRKAYKTPTHVQNIQIGELSIIILITNRAICMGWIGLDE